METKFMFSLLFCERTFIRFCVLRFVPFSTSFFYFIFSAIDSVTVPLFAVKYPIGRIIILLFFFYFFVSLVERIHSFICLNLVSIES